VEDNVSRSNAPDQGGDESRNEDFSSDALSFDENMAAIRDADISDDVSEHWILASSEERGTWRKDIRSSTKDKEHREAEEEVFQGPSTAAPGQPTDRQQKCNSLQLI